MVNTWVNSLSWFLEGTLQMCVINKDINSINKRILAVLNFSSVFFFSKWPRFFQKMINGGDCTHGQVFEWNFLRKILQYWNRSIFFLKVLTFTKFLAFKPCILNISVFRERNTHLSNKNKKSFMTDMNYVRDCLNLSQNEQHKWTITIFRSPQCHGHKSKRNFTVYRATELKTCRCKNLYTNSFAMLF